MGWGLVYWGRLEGRQELESESGLGGRELEWVNEEQRGLRSAGGRYDAGGGEEGRRQ